MKRGVRKAFAKFDTTARKIKTGVANDGHDVESAILKAGQSLKRIPQVAEKMAVFVESLGTAAGDTGNLGKDLHGLLKNMPELETDTEAHRFDTSFTDEIRRKLMFPKTSPLEDAAPQESTPRFEDADRGSEYWDRISAEYETLGEQLEKALDMLKESGEKAERTESIQRKKQNKVHSVER